MFENTLTGLPICRPLFLNDPNDKSLYNDKESFLDNEFFVGNDLLIAPVLEPQVQNGYNNYGKRDVYLPEGSSWYCFMNNVMPLGPATEGGTTIRDFDANLNLNGSHINFIVPAYVRAGAVIPTIELEQYVGQLKKEGRPNPITLNIYPDPDRRGGKYDMYLDDGESRSSADVKAHPIEFGGDPQANSEYRNTRITHTYTGEKTRQIAVERIYDGYTPPMETYFFVAVLHDPSEAKGSSSCLKSVTIDGKQIDFIIYGSPEQRSAGLAASSVNAWYYNENIGISFIKVFDSSPKITIAAEYC
jgi:alpha-glucosidase